MLLWCCLLNWLLLLHDRNLTTHQDAGDAVVHIIDHSVPYLCTLQLEDKQWVLLLVAGILYRVLQLIELAEVLLPVIIDDVEYYALLELLHYVLCLCLVSLLQVACDVVHALAVGDRHHDALVHRTLVFIYLLDDRHCCSLDAVGLALEGSHSLLEGTLSHLVASAVLVFLLCERNLHGENLQELFLGTGEVVVVHDVQYAVPDYVGDIHTDTLTHQGVATLLVDNGTLTVHHVIILQEVLTDTEVVLLNLALCTLDALADHWAFDTFAILETETVHYLGNALRSEQTHQLIFQ